MKILFSKYNLKCELKKQIISSLNLQIKEI